HSARRRGCPSATRISTSSRPLSHLKRELGHDRLAGRQRGPAVFSTGPGGRLDRLLDLAVSAPGAAAYYLRWCVLVGMGAQLQRALELERAGRVGDQRRRPHGVVPALALAYLAADQQPVRPHTVIS